MQKVIRQALRTNNKGLWLSFLEEASNYIKGLTDVTGVPMHMTKRKTGFVGFLVAIESLKLLFKELVEGEKAPMNDLLTYKFSQDHLELFFCAFDQLGALTTIPPHNNLQQHIRGS